MAAHWEVHFIGAGQRLWKGATRTFCTFCSTARSHEMMRGHPRLKGVHHAGLWLPFNLIWNVLPACVHVRGLQGIFYQFIAIIHKYLNATGTTYILGLLSQLLPSWQTHWLRLSLLSGAKKAANLWFTQQKEGDCGGGWWVGVDRGGVEDHTPVHCFKETLHNGDGAHGRPNQTSHKGEPKSWDSTECAHLNSSSELEYVQMITLC